ncbi:hypothetical protein JQS43_11620 [Natronosporangium hydrolyticum]|uniref:Uncharacterized protein n=1 Tax=Natronosporangium hydrolyticum TaxID=2811111 RepID=A0A895YS75_9ACTN|nr:hypothetical protein [Natronosporangium hydrolyticum]QSB16868.1 hypothetical protein JQS43_11620 [Natronosporangium hydrolyticum]
MNSADLDALTPAEVETYLASAGWVEQQRAPHAVLWTTGEGDDEVELLLPLNPAYRDYSARLRETVRTIALAEERDAREVLADLTATTVDTQRFRLLPDLPSGSIPLVDIVDVTRGVRDLMFTAAHATVIDTPMVVQPRPRPQEANRFVRGVRLVAPTPGSFVLSVHIPLDRQREPGRPPRQTSPDSSPLPLSRRVALKLHQAVAATCVAADEAAGRDSLLPFTDRAADGVSADLCEAISLVGRGQPFDLQFAWAQALPTRLGGNGFAFDRRRIDIIKAAATDLPSMAADSDAVVVARVVRLDRTVQATGTVTLRGALEGRTGPRSEVRLTASLPSHFYDTAVVAHRSRRRVRVVGSLRGRELHAVTAVHLLDDEP